MIVHLYVIKVSNFNRVSKVGKFGKLNPFSNNKDISIFLQCYSLSVGVDSHVPGLVNLGHGTSTCSSSLRV